MLNSANSILSRDRWLAVALISLLVGAGLAIRLYDLADLPLDFHPTRQLLSHLKARGMYYQAHPELPEWQRKMAIQQWKTKAEVEPEVFERLVAATYELTGPSIHVARVYASAFWLLGGVFVFLLVRGLFSQDVAALALAYFLFVPYGILASRSFQPDSLMIMLTLLAWWALFKWSRTGSWVWAAVAGLSGGLAIFVKFVAAFFVIAAALGLGLGQFGRRLFAKPQVWVMTAVGVLPAALYLYYGVVTEGFLGRQFGGRFVPALLIEPANYLRWGSMANLAAGGVAIGLGVLGLLIARDRQLRLFLGSLWIAYALFGLVFDYHVATHDYYHLPLIAIVAVSSAPVASLLLEHLAPLAPGAWQRLVVVALVLYAVFAGAWEARGQMASVDYRGEVAMWDEIGDRLGHGPNVVALTPDYGSRLAYWGWQNSIAWPYSGDFEYRQVRGGELGFDEAFLKLTEGNTFFLVTDFVELERQPALANRLGAYAVFAEGDGYIIYDLERMAA